VLAGRDEGLRQKLERRIAERDIGDHVQFVGEYRDVSSLFAAADFAVLSSWEEGFSNVVLEAMIAGLPMVVTDVGGNPEAVLHGKTGLVVPPHNPSALGRAILRLARDRGLRERLGNAGRTRVEQEFSLERCVDDHHNLYEELLEVASKLPK
jgi:glycosyltransferase involved in cell wall biosynthesis